MANGDIRGTVTDQSGNPVQGAVVEVTRAESSGTPEEGNVIRTTTDSNGDYQINGFPNGDRTSDEWHVAAYYYDGSDWVPAVNRPAVTASLGSSAIPDSARNHWPMDEGTGSTIADVIGGADASITGDPVWVSGDYTGGVALDWDGVDDFASATVDVSAENEWMLSTTIETNTTERGEIHWWDEDDSFGIVGLDTNQSSGKATWSVGDGSSVNSVETTTTITDGEKHRISSGVIENDQVFIAVDGTIEDSTSFGTVGPIASDFYFSSNRNIPREYDGISDNPIIYTDASQSTIDDDFALQTWS